MRYLDIAVAALIGASAIAGLAAWGPGGPDSYAHQKAVQSALWGDLQEFVQKQGTAWVVESTPAQFCAALAEASSRSFTLTGALGGHSCGAPPAGSVAVGLSFTLGGREAVLEAWSYGEG